MAYETYIYEKKGKIAYITLNRPEALNALNLKMFIESGEIWRDFNKDPNVWVAIVTGAGRGTCVGVDVKAVAKGEFVMPKMAKDETGVDHIGPRHYNVTKPVIGAINGYCCGAGLDLATEPDIVIASEKAEFWDPHVSVGLVSNHEMVQMAKKTSLGVALQMGLMGARFRMNAKRAYEVGLVAEVVPHEKLMARAEEIANAILEQSPLGVMGTKACIWNGIDKPLEEAISKGEYIRREIIGTEDYWEGSRAFAEKRAPVWKGK